jgi:hypothetical protein
VRALATERLLVEATFFFQYRMGFTQTACVCALLLRIRKDPRVLPSDAEGLSIPFVLAGDEALALSQHVLRPYPNKTLTGLKRIYSYRLSTARRIVECTFGILADKWRIFYRPIDVRSGRNLKVAA